MNLLTAFPEGARWLLLLLLAVPVLVWWAYIRRRPGGVRFWSIGPVARLGNWRVRWRWLLPAMRAAALVLLVVCLARPQKGDEQARIPTEGIAIQLLVDRSGSMAAMDFQIAGQRVSRLAAVQNVVRDFVTGRGGLRGRPDDLVGMITFAKYADDQCPLTLDHEYLIEALDQAKVAMTQDEDGTAIGDAIGLGVERMHGLDEQQRIRGAQKIKSKVMILLTDGENNAGDLDPLKAAELAASRDIRIYTIGAGTRGMAPMPVRNPFTGREEYQSVPVSIDEDTLRKIADQTGGQYFRATDTDSLRNVYAEIDKLEKTRTVELRYFQYTEFATHGFKIGHLRVPPLLLLAFVLVALELVLAHTWWRRIP